MNNPYNARPLRLEGDSLTIIRITNVKKGIELPGLMARASQIRNISERDPGEIPRASVTFCAGYGTSLGKALRKVRHAPVRRNLNNQGNLCPPRYSTHLLSATPSPYTLCPADFRANGIFYLGALASVTWESIRFVIENIILHVPLSRFWPLPDYV